MGHELRNSSLRVNRKISKANEFTDKLIAVENRAEEINRTLYFLNQEIAKIRLFRSSRDYQKT